MASPTDDLSPNSRVPWLMLGLAVALLFAAFWGGLENVFHRWLREEEYSHGFFIPLIAGWLLWRRRDVALASVGAPSWAGTFLVVVAAGMLVLGELSAIYLLLHLGFVLALAGLALAVGGGSLLRVVGVPIAFLLFAIPAPYFLDAQLSWQLQLVSSRLGVALLRLVDVPVYLEGNVIDLGVYKLQVVEACSGLRYLYPLLSLGFLAAYFFRAPLWQRAVVFLSTIPITVLMNSVRIAVIGVLVGRWGTGMAEGFLHFFEGWVIFMACALLLLGEIWLFARLSGRRLDAVLGPPDVKAVAVLPGSARERPWPLVAAVVLLAAGAVAVTTLTHREEHSPERQRLVTFPLTLDGWRAQEGHLDTEIETALGLDDYLLADYRRGPAEVVNVYVGYYASQRKGVSPHSPRVCMPGGGWRITDLARNELAVVPGEAPFPVNRALIERGDQRQLVYYWFEQRGRRMANEYLMKWYLLQDAILMNRTDGALVRLTTPLREGEPVEAGEARLKDLMTRLVPLLERYVPE